MILRGFLIVSCLLCLFLAGTTLSIAQTKTNKALQCPAHPPSIINILPYRTDIVYDFTKTKLELTELSSGAYSPYAAHQQTVTQGLSSPEISIDINTYVSAKLLPENPTLGCAFIRKIDLRINIDPRVFVAKEHPEGSCMHKAILTHELKHVRVNREVINEYAQKIGKALEQTINARNGQYGPLAAEEIPNVQRNVGASFLKLIDGYNTVMLEEATRRQKNVDTLEEYHSVGADCSENVQHNHNHK